MKFNRWPFRSGGILLFCGHRTCHRSLKASETFHGKSQQTFFPKAISTECSYLLCNFPSEVLISLTSADALWPQLSELLQSCSGQVRRDAVQALEKLGTTDLTIRKEVTEWLGTKTNRLTSYSWDQKKKILEVSSPINAKFPWFCEMNKFSKVMRLEVLERRDLPPASGGQDGSGGYAELPEHRDSAPGDGGVGGS